MKASERTKSCKRKALAFTIISVLLWIGAALFAVISAITIATGGSGTHIITEEFKAKLISLSVSAIILLILTAFMGEKLRMLTWMLSMILSTICYGEVAMYIVFGVWLLDEYLFSNLAKYYRNKVSINKEIDLRG